ncbi:MAG: hypothetical protein RBQ65_01540 [Sphaerochaeta sp.]|nr:hypothetical protein [Sphaerochaeta sp.]
MRILPLCETASLALDRLVMSCQNQPSNAELYQTVHEKTQQLLYELPSHLHVLDEEECASFLFFCWDAIDHYITTFRTGRLSYLGYLSQVVRQRSRYYIAQQRERAHKERLLIKSQPYAYDDDSSSMTGESEYPYGPSCDPATLDIENLPSLFNQLLTAKAGPPKRSSPAISEQLQALFLKETNRRRLLIVLTLCPDMANTHLLDELSLLLGVDRTCLSTYLATAEILLEKKRHCREEFEAVSNRHFRRLLEIEAQIDGETEEEELERLRALREWTAGVYKAKVTKIREQEMALTHNEASRILGIPKGTVDSSVYYIRRLLQSYMDETGGNEYP